MPFASMNTSILQHRNRKRNSWHTGIFLESARYSGLIGNGSGNIYMYAQAAQPTFAINAKMHTRMISAHQACPKHEAGQPFLPV